MTEKFNAVDNSSIVPVILPIAPDNCENSVVDSGAGEKRARSDCGGFFRLTVEEFCESAIGIGASQFCRGEAFRQTIY